MVDKYPKSRPSIPTFVEQLYWAPTLSQVLSLVLRHVGKNNELAAPGESTARVCCNLLWTLEPGSYHQANCTYIGPWGDGRQSHDKEGPLAFWSPSPSHTSCNVQALVFCTLATCVCLFSRKLNLQRSSCPQTPGKRSISSNVHRPEGWLLWWNHRSFLEGGGQGGILRFWASSLRWVFHCGVLVGIVQFVI